MKLTLVFEIRSQTNCRECKWHNSSGYGGRWRCQVMSPTHITVARCCIWLTQDNKQQFHVLSESLDDVAPAEHTKNTNNTSGLWDVFTVWDALRIVISDVWFEADTSNPKCTSLLSLLHAIDKGIIHGLHHLMILVTSHKGKEWLQTQNVFAKLVVTP